MTDDAPARPRTRMRPDDRRAQLLDVAELLVAEGGPNAVTVDAIAARAEVTKGLLYHYFDDREALLAALLDRSYERFRSEVAVRLEAATTFDAKLGVLSRQAIEPSPSYAIASALQAVRSETGALQASQERQALAVGIGLAQLIHDEYGLGIVEASVLAGTVLGASSGFGFTWRASSWSIDEAADRLHALCRALIDVGVRSLPSD